VTPLIDSAEQAGAAGDRQLHHNLLWVTAIGTFWTGRLRPETRQLLVEAANRAGPPTATDSQLVAIHAYADPFASAPRVVDCLRDATNIGIHDTERATYLAAAALLTGAYSYSLTFWATAIDNARAEGRLGALPRLLTSEAMIAARQPNWNIAIPAAEEARRLATELKQPHWLAMAETVVAMIASVRGDVASMEQATARAERIALPLGATHIVAMAQRGPILTMLALGRYEEALQVAERLFDVYDPAYHPYFACTTIGEHAEAAAYAGRTSSGRERLAEVEAAVGDAPTEWMAINLRHARAVLADDEHEAAERYDAALNADLDHWPLWRGRLLLAHGRWLRRHRQVTDSRASLRQARDLFDAVGAINWADQARSELRAAGESSRRRDHAARDDLTAQELQIAQLAAGGLSNRDIGQRLYLSHRTIGTHLYRVFPKLGITSRAELTAALASATAPAS
jgi:DNA-binding CsgD family transcriptional regulator